RTANFRPSQWQIAKSLHLLAVILHDAIDLLSRQHILPLTRAAFAEETLGLFGFLAEAFLVFLRAKLLERRGLNGGGKLLFGGRKQEMTGKPAERFFRLGEHVFIAHDVDRPMRLARPAQHVLAPGAIDFVHVLVRDRQLRVRRAHNFNGLVNRYAIMVSIGNRDIQWIADDIDRSRGHFEVDCGRAAVDDQGLMRLDEQQPVVIVRRPALDFVPHRGNFVAMLVGRLEAQDARIKIFTANAASEAADRIDVLAIRFAEHRLEQVVQENAGPGVSRLGVGGEPDNSGSRDAARRFLWVGRLGRLDYHVTRKRQVFGSFNMLPYISSVSLFCYSSFGTTFKAFSG